MTLTKLLFLLSSLVSAQQLSQQYSLTANGSTTVITNQTIGCLAWAMSFDNQGFSGLTMALQSSVNGTTWVNFVGTAVAGSNPSTSTTTSLYTVTGYNPFIRVTLSGTSGTGQVNIQLKCWQSPNYVSSLPTQTNTFTALQTFTSGTALDIAFIDYEVSGCPAGCTNPAITQAQILAMDVTPVTIVAAQGSGTTIIPDMVVFEVVPTATAYAAGTTWGLYYNGVGGNIVQSPACTAATILATVNTICEGIANGAASFASTQRVNLPVTLNTASATAFTCSGTCGTLSYWLKYHVVLGL